MAATTNLVQRITWVGSVVCAWVGSSPAFAELFFLAFNASDSEADLTFKRNAAKLLARSAIAEYPVTITHADGNALIDGVNVGEFDISPVGYAIHNDFYSITGSGIPGDVEVIFDSPPITVAVTPDLIRPHWVVLASLPATIPVGRNRVRLQGTGFVSEWVPVDVSAGSPVEVRVLYTGQPKDRPYNFVFVANPAIQTEASSLIRDPVMTNRAGYQDVVTYCLRNILTLTEDLLRQGGWDAQMRFVSVYDTVPTVSDSNALAAEFNPDIMGPRRAKLNAFLSPYSETADMVYVIHGSTTHGRASAQFTSDDGARAGTAFTYDGAAQSHRHFPSTPGSAALPLNMLRTGLTPLHEYGHGGSDFVNGMVIDLYVDSSGGGFPVVNKKQRARSTDPIPASFASYNGTNYVSDQNRDSLGYQAGWTSYHPALIDAAHPNLMDNYWLAPGGNPQVCRLDGLTYTWYTDRLRAKLGR
jgi:hypothetical protein